MKKQTLIILFGSSLMMLAACTATTGTASNVSTKPVAASSMRPTQPGDGAMSCEQLTTEINALDTRIAETQSLANQGAARNVQKQATDSAIRYGAVKSGLLHKVPFGGSLLNSALNAKRNSDQAKMVAAQQDAQNAEMRRTSLMGIYTGKGCS